jgi:hypothetical protein
MPPIRTDSNDLLLYNATYRILICRECQYAIQKSAVSSHLLRHKIYREDRQHLLSSIAHLDLVEPDHVLLPNSSSSPIDSITVISGYRCAEAGCKSLCASLKRMKRHRNEVHNIGEDGASPLFSHPVKLQTFFRGTKLRYFEVTPLCVEGLPEGSIPGTENIGGCGPAMRGRGEDGQDEMMHETIAMNPVPQQQYIHGNYACQRSSAINIDLDVLTYFHHFASVTSFTLPATLQQPYFWHTEFIRLALQRQSLMSGLLALSACHLAALAADTSVKKVHHARSAEFSNGFRVAWSELDGITAEEEERVDIAAQQISSLLSCARWDSTGPALDKECSLQTCITTLRSLAVAEPTPSFTGEEQKSIFAKAKSILDAGPSSSASRDCTTRDVLLDRLRILPSCLSETFGRPSEVKSVLATLSAIAALVVCCEASFASDNRDLAWRAMVLWLIKLPEHFNHMVARRDPAAMAVMEVWLLLVQRAEDCGFWFLKGLSDKLYSEDRRKR